MESNRKSKEMPQAMKDKWGNTRGKTKDLPKKEFLPSMKIQVGNTSYLLGASSVGHLTTLLNHYDPETKKSRLKEEVIETCNQDLSKALQEEGKKQRQISTIIKYLNEGAITIIEEYNYRLGLIFQNPNIDHSNFVPRQKRSRFGGGKK